MSNEISTINEDSLSTATAAKLDILTSHVAMLENCHKLASHYTRTAMVPKQYQGKAEDAAVAIQWGIEIGLQPLQALQNIAVINGNPALWGDGLIALVKGSGLCEYINTTWDSSTQTATVTTKRKGEPLEEIRSYSIEDAQKAGLASRATYQQHAKRMISARARSHVLRDVYADLLKGFHVREILEEDQHKEKDITPATPNTKSSTLNKLLNKPVEEKPAEAIEVVAVTVEDVIFDLELCDSLERLKAAFSEGYKRFDGNAEAQDRITIRKEELKLALIKEGD